MSEYVEWRQFEVGELVRIRLTECDSHWHAGVDRNGHVGIVDDVEPAEEEEAHAEPNHRGHRIFVSFDWLAGSYYAANELEPAPERGEAGRP